MNESPPRSLAATLIATSLCAILTGAIGKGRADAAVLCKRNRTGAVFVRNACQKKESEMDLTDFFSGGGGAGGTGGGSGSLEPEIDRSGSRLHVRYFTGADGSREFIGFYDGQRNENCSFIWPGSAAADGTTRCLPLDNLAYLNDSYFADSSCTQPLPLAFFWSGSTNCPAPAYIAQHTSNQCPMVWHLYEIGAQFTGSAYAIMGSLGCRAATLPTGYTIYTVGNEVPASAFVEASEQVVVGASRDSAHVDALPMAPRRITCRGWYLT